MSEFRKLGTSDSSKLGQPAYLSDTKLRESIKNPNGQNRQVNKGQTNAPQTRKFSLNSLIGKPSRWVSSLFSRKITMGSGAPTYGLTDIKSRKPNLDALGENYKKHLASQNQSRGIPRRTFKQATPNINESRKRKLEVFGQTRKPREEEMLNIPKLNLLDLMNRADKLIRSNDTTDKIMIQAYSNAITSKASQLTTRLEQLEKLDPKQDLVKNLRVQIQRLNVINAQLNEKLNPLTATKSQAVTTKADPIPISPQNAKEASTPTNIAELPIGSLLKEAKAIAQNPNITDNTVIENYRFGISEKIKDLENQKNELPNAGPGIIKIKLLDAEIKKLNEIDKALAEKLNPSS